ncbi:hypothetical protein [Thalassovita sp.]|uniref:hypothetical protein n=1 Tax=Thalassovita sp. TaxID=1979401 RepID=UPI0029DE7E9D|nr:hypothetical protein [Thalassovita sp.]
MLNHDGAPDFRVGSERHARLFELIRQQNLIASRKVGRKQLPLDDPAETAFLTAAEGSLLTVGGYL